MNSLILASDEQGECHGSKRLLYLGNWQESVCVSGRSGARAGLRDGNAVLTVGNSNL